MGWRLLITTNTNPYYVTALDEALTIARKENKTANTLHFYQRNPAAVSVGRSKKIQEDVCIEECKKNNVAILRRTTGGGTIFTDKGCLIYSLIFNNHDLQFTTHQDLFSVICNSIGSALQKLDITTVYKPPNDILLHNKKISGSAQIKKKDIIQIHGTLLINTDLLLLSKVLKNSKIDTMTTICKEIKKPLSIKKIRDVLINEFKSTLNTNFTSTPLSDYEKKLCTTLLENRYHNNAWTYAR